MFRRTFTWGTSEDTGLAGWILDGMDGFDPSHGLGVAHDVLEHFNAHDSSVEHELRAFGAMLYVRAFPGYFDRNRSRFWSVPEGCSSWAYTAGGELAEIIIKAGWSVAPARAALLGDEEEEVFQGLDAQFKKELPEFWELHRYGEEEPSPEEVDALLANVKAWIRKGYRQAVRRYKGIGTDTDACEMFIQIMEATDRDAQRMGAQRMGGERLRVTVHPSRIAWDLEVSPFSGGRYEPIN